MAKLKPIHPGEILREEFMAPLRLNANKLALALHVPAPTIYDIVHEERGISPEMALRLGRFFRTTPDFWLNLQSEFDLRIVRSQKEATVKSQVRPLDQSAWVSGSSRTMLNREPQLQFPNKQMRNTKFKNPTCRATRQMGQPQNHFTR